MGHQLEETHHHDELERVEEVSKVVRQEREARTALEAATAEVSKLEAKLSEVHSELKAEQERSHGLDVKRMEASATANELRKALAETQAQGEAVMATKDKLEAQLGALRTDSDVQLTRRLDSARAEVDAASARLAEAHDMARASQARAPTPLSY